MRSEIESAEAFAERVPRTRSPCDFNSVMAKHALREAVAARDAAIRAEMIGELRKMAADGVLYPYRITAISDAADRLEAEIKKAGE